MCGDGLDVLGTHECDDGNLHDEDGCDENCVYEPVNFDCGTPIAFPTVCTEYCDGNWMRFLECDGAPFCDGACTTLPDIECTVPALVCTEICGNSIKTPGKACEDGSGRGDDRLVFDGCDWLC